ncbi:hypothetical protein Syun_021649 [Stephania yunnanensis]|uniref:Cytochrome P450 n=1 Tax=Stephania yunnanensis TaxID=152371 RepID=A0AAP0IGD8_9MAGN
MHIRLGLVPTIVVSSVEAAQLFLKTHDAVFCSRPKIPASELISYGNKGVAFAEYGPYWRHMRKLCTLELLTNAKIEMFEEMRRGEVCGVVEEIKGVGRAGNSCQGVVNVSYRKRGLAHQMKRINKDLDALFNKIIDEHMRSTKEKQGSDHKDFINIIMDASATASLWTLSELMKHPFALKKAQEELKDVIGLDRMVEEKDLVKLEYLNIVIKETLRLHPVAPLLLPRESVKDIIGNDYLIPKKFANTDIDLYGRNFELIPFGAGRRVCPGLQIGLRSIQLVLAQLLHCFNWELPNSVLSPCDLDMGMEFGLVVSRAKHLFAKPSSKGCVV